MSVETQAVLAGQVAAAAKAAGLVVVSSAVGKDFSDNPTTRFSLGLASDQAKTEVLELSDTFDFGRKELLDDVAVYLAESAKHTGNALDSAQIASIIKVVGGDADANVRTSAARALGALNVPSNQASALILQQIK